MNAKELKELAKKQFIYMDGATGSNLVKAGMPAGVCPEGWIMTHPEAIVSLQKKYIEAGSNIVLAPTFGLNRIKLEDYGFEHRVDEMNHILVALSQKACEGTGALVAGDLTMTGKQLKPFGTLEFEELVDVYKEQVTALEDAGVDLYVIETMTSIQETRAALLAVRELSEKAVICSVTFEENGRTMFGTDAATAAVTLSSLGASAIGVNCSLGPKALKSIVESMATHCDIPIMAKPNAGLPTLNEQNETVYSLAPKQFAEEMQELIEAGASIIGGCCGTTPEHIAELKKATEGKVPVIVEKTDRCYLSSERKNVAINLNEKFYIVGERINPTGKKALQAQLREGSTEMVLTFADEQEENGASVLDINMGMGDIDEKAMMLRVISEVSAQSDLPLSLDTTNVEVMEAALRHYPGRALVNSVSYESVKYEKLLPIVAKYGSMFILLPLSDEGLPKSIEEKIEIIEKIKNRALELGMKKEDIVVDALVNTVAANKNGALEALETIRYCKENGLATICGLSNISFGLPQRGAVNTAFLTMAIQTGLTMAIANPNQRILTDAAFASEVLLNRPNADMRYIEYCASMPEVKPAAVKEAAPTPVKSGKQLELPEAIKDSEELKTIFMAVLEGRKETALNATKSYCHDEETAQSVLNNALLTAIDEVGHRFEKGIYFLPQLIASAEAMKGSIEYIKPMLKSSADKQLGTVVIATVKGDIHDIGKNLVTLMLSNNGFKVIDLGKDVENEAIIEAAKENNADIIALSALMTTTMIRMPEVLELAKKELPGVKVIIGGAVVTQDYCDRIKADGYSKDAADCVTLCKKLLNIV